MKKKQLSEAAIRERLRLHVPGAIEVLVKLMDEADNDSVRLGAVKTILSKVAPDLKAVDLKSGAGAFEVIIKNHTNESED